MAVSVGNFFFFLAIVKKENSSELFIAKSQIDFIRNDI